MKITQLQDIKKLYFGYEDVARAFGITAQSAKVTLNRYLKQGLLIRVKRNIYILKEKWKNLDREQKFVIANIVQVHSYISLMTALDYYEITTQMQHDYIEYIAVKRTKGIEINQTVFNYSKISVASYCGFLRMRDFFIATPEKAFIDAVYLRSLGRYNFDISSIDFDKLNKQKIGLLIKSFPMKVENYLTKIMNG